MVYLICVGSTRLACAEPQEYLVLRGNLSFRILLAPFSNIPREVDEASFLAKDYLNLQREQSENFQLLRRSLAQFLVSVRIDILSHK